MPGGLTLLASLPADIPTPAAGKVTIFFNLTTGLPSYKDDTGVTHTLVGTAGVTGSAGPSGSPGYGFDGNDADLLIFPGPKGDIGATGVTGAVGPIGPPVMLLEDALQGEDGLPIPSQSSGSLSQLFTATVILTDAEIKSLNTSPKEIIPAPGVGKIVIPLGMQWVSNFTVVYNAASTVGLRPNGVALALTTLTSLLQNATPRRYGFFPAILVGNTGIASVENLSIVLFQSANITGGDPANSLSVIVPYYIFTF